jgi:hypothetical protein
MSALVPNAHIRCLKRHEFLFVSKERRTTDIPSEIGFGFFVPKLLE